MDMDQALQTFIAESRELLQDMEDRLLHINHVDGDERTEAVNAIFRAAHTIKGSAGLFGLEDIVGFTHVLESVLDRVRGNELDIDDALVSLLLLCKDHVGHMVERLAGADDPSGYEIHGEGVLLLQKLAHFEIPAAKHTASKPTEAAVIPPKSSDVEVETVGGGMVDSDNWHISLHFGRDVLRNGMDPLSFFRYLNTIGQIVSMDVAFDDMPVAAEMDPESCYLAYELSFKSEVDKATIESAFEFVQDDCQVRILPPHSLVADFVELISSMPKEEQRIGQMLLRCGTLTERELAMVLEIQAQAAAGKGSADSRLPLGQIMVEQGLVQPAVVEAALEKQQQQRKVKTKQQQSVRVDADKLDHLINLIGELVIAGAGVNIVLQRSRMAQLMEATSTMNRLIEEVRDSALNLRMVQIGETFNRFQRVVHDVAADLGKDIALKISGGDTELDKTVIEKIGDPLTHLVRNSIDHGIEDAATRVQRGKPAGGTVRLNAFHESGSIVIEVADDGGGLNRERIYAKACEKGLITAGQELSDQEVYQLIFEAGFSTADKVSNISGRGVGMDVVRRNIEALRGTIDIDSRYLQGTTIRIRLPLTLAIIDGFLVGVGRSSYVIPLDMVVECIDLDASGREAISLHSYINLRGEVLPVVRLRELFETAAEEELRRESIVVVQYGSLRAGLVVDTLQGEFQTVIKPLGKLFERMRCIGGSTILGSGEVALILDVPHLIQIYTHASSNKAATAPLTQLPSF